MNADLPPGFASARTFDAFLCHLFGSFPDLLVDMMPTQAMETIESGDASLVTESLTGNREAFGHIVARYQTLICSLAYSSTGSLSQSEDLAQETFVAAWKQLGNLREPHKLRSWLCQIVRNLTFDALKQQGREPSHAAEPLETAWESVAPGPLPIEQTISNEEQAILWRSLERIPDFYREPLVLFYREHQSIAAVAQNLELTEDTVKQRLSRGRKLLHEQVLAFVEGALERTSPGKAFTVGVLMALPAFSISAKAAAVGVAAAKGGTAAKAAAASGLLSALLTPMLGFFGNYIGYRISMDGAQTDHEREYIKSFYRKLIACILGFFVAYGLLLILAKRIIMVHDLLFTSLIIGLVLAFTFAVFAHGMWSLRTRRRFGAQLTAKGVTVNLARPAWEYRSKFVLLGLPFIHIRVSGGLTMPGKPVKAWIAAGDCAVGLLFAFGGMAIAPVSIGGMAMGLLPFGGCAVGVFALGGFSLGVWSFGGLALGWQVFGGCAIGWNAALGGVAIAHDYALGGIVQAAQANNEIAARFMQLNPFFQHAPIALRYLAWLNLLWIIPMLVWWRVVSCSRRRREQGNS
jgi:RNA polymerase sigma factor (sigma-70 family)